MLLRAYCRAPIEPAPPLVTTAHIAFGYEPGQQLSYAEANADPQRCAARLVQLGPYMAVIDNVACGGLNVSFTGLYSRQ